LTTNNALLSNVNEADLKLAHRKGSWTFDVLSAIHKIPGANVHIFAIMSRSKINMSDFETLLHACIHLKKEYKKRPGVHGVRM